MIPVHPRRKRAGAGQLAQEESKALQQRISDIVAQHLVDDLEVQDVKGQHGVVRRVGGLQQRVAVDLNLVKFRMPVSVSVKARARISR